MEVNKKLPPEFGIMCYNKEDSWNAGKFIEAHCTLIHSMSWNNTGKSIYGRKNGLIDCWSNGAYDSIPLFSLEQIRELVKEESIPKSEVINQYEIY